MQVRGYFVSDDAENAATSRVVETFATANSACAKFEGEMSVLGKELEGLVRALSHPKKHVFEVGKDDVRVWEDMNGSPFTKRARITAEQYNFQNLSDLLSNYGRARKDREESAARLKSMGIPVAG